MGMEGDKWNLLIIGINGNIENKRENVGAGGNTLEYKGKKVNLCENVRINNVVDKKGGFGVIQSCML